MEFYYYYAKKIWINSPLQVLLSTSSNETFDILVFYIVRD